MMHIRIYACWLLLYFHLHRLCLAFIRVFYQTLLMHPSLWHLDAGKEEKNSNILARLIFVIIWIYSCGSLFISLITKQTNLFFKYKYYLLWIKICIGEDHVYIIKRKLLCNSRTENCYIIILLETWFVKTQKGPTKRRWVHFASKSKKKSMSQ